MKRSLTFAGTLLASLATLTVMTLSACSDAPYGPNASQQPDPSAGANAPKDATLANGWTEIRMIANFADTRLNITGHFNTTRNACGKEEDGALDISVWNTLAADLNTAIGLTPLTDDNEYCVDAPTSKGMDGSVDLILPGGAKRALFDNHGAQICSTISDHHLSDEILAQLNQIVIIADKEACPNGYTLTDAH